MTTQELTTLQDELNQIRTSDQALIFVERWVRPLVKDASQVHLLRDNQGVSDPHEFCSECGSELFHPPFGDGLCGECQA